MECVPQQQCDAVSLEAGPRCLDNGPEKTTGRTGELSLSFKCMSV